MVQDLFNAEVEIRLGRKMLGGHLMIPDNARAIVIFSHGSGSSRFSKRNLWVAEQLNRHHLGTLLFDLLTEEEDRTYANRFNIDLLSQRLTDVTEWLQEQPEAKGCRLGYFGASTGAASALQAAAQLPTIDAVVSRGGRPDLAMHYLPRVNAATLLIVGSLDTEVIEMNRAALEKLKYPKELRIVNGASHLFEEPGKLAEVASLASEWYTRYLLPFHSL